ncbi:hypothetical protein EDC01DRAFT_488665 [Geopyxis carbonaria]|nr:hypothetical protein EDC01DRAFT_488665 [Geopyxis carbonaria]
MAETVSTPDYSPNSDKSVGHANFPQSPNSSLDTEKRLQGVLATSGTAVAHIEDRSEENPQPQRRKRLSFGGGNDGRGAPMFSKLEASKSKHLSDGYEDMKPPDGYIGGAFKRFINAKSGSMIAGGK